MRRRRHVRIPALVLLLTVGVGLAACDTNDGRDMKQPDPYQVYRLENSTPSTTSTTTTIAPPTTPAPSTSVVDTAATIAETSVDAAATAAETSVDASSGSVVDTAAATGAGESTLPVDTFAESQGVANLAADGVDFAGPWISGGEIAVDYTCNGDQAVPLLTWTAPPEGTVEMALVVVDETANDFAHWIVIGLPPEAGSLGGADPIVVGTEATNSAGDIGWTGPCPPDPDIHTYRFTLYALNQVVELPPESPSGDLIEAIEAAATGAASFTGTYQVA